MLALGQGCLSVGPGTTFLTATFKELGESLSVVLVLVREDSRVHKGDEVRGALPRVFKVKAGATWDVCRGRDRERDMVGVSETKHGQEVRELLGKMASQSVFTKQWSMRIRVGSSLRLLQVYEQSTSGSSIRARSLIVELNMSASE